TELAHKSTQPIQCAERNARFLFGCGSAALRNTSDTGVWVLKQPQHRARLYNHAAMVPLPIDASLPEIIANLRESRALVLVAPPGAGKTTRVPPAILRANLLSPEHPNLLVLQPRRVAAPSLAARIADENNWKLGNEVGYHVRFDRMMSKNTRLRVLTEGILTRQLLDDPYLDGVGAVLLDEFHERSLHTGVAVAVLRNVQQTVRPDLMLIIMPATLEAEPAAKYLGGCPIVRVEGRTY